MNDMHRAVHLETGKIIEVSTHIAKQPDLMLQYGYILQEMPSKSNQEIEVSEETETVSEKPKRSYNKQNK